MSFLTELSKRKQELKPTATTVTRVDGRRYVERAAGSGAGAGAGTGAGEGAGAGVGDACAAPCYGFVVDTKPDDTPALLTQHLYIGSQDCAAHPVLHKYSITRVLSLGVEAQLSGIRCKFIPCLDLPETDIRPIVAEALPFVREAVLRGDNVLVHCNAGVSRTGMLAVAYLMLYEGMDFGSAYGLVKSKRASVQPNPGFVRQLKQIGPADAAML